MKSQLGRFLAKAVFALAFLGGGAQAEEVPLNSKTREELEERTSELAKLRESGNLTAEQRAELDRLWQDATVIQQLNDRCREISLNQALDFTCTDFYMVKLPKFENDYFKVTGQIRLSGMRIKEATKNRKQMIEACFEAFPFLDMKPQNAYPMSVDYSLEPLSDSVEAEYIFSLSYGPRNEGLTEYYEDWIRVCKPYIFRQTDKTEFAPLFVELLSNAKNTWFEFQASRGDMELVLSRDLWITYLVNDKPVFEVKIPKGTRFSTYQKSGRTRVTYSNEEIAAKGLKSDIRYSDSKPSTWKTSGLNSDREGKTKDEKNSFLGLMLYGGYGDFVVKSDNLGSYLSRGFEIGIGFFWRYYFYEWGSFQTGLNLNLFSLTRFYNEAYDESKDFYWYDDKYSYYKVYAFEVPLQLRLGMPLFYGTALFTFRCPRLAFVEDDATENYDTSLFGFTGYAGFGAEITRDFLVDVLFLLFDLGVKSDYYAEQDNGVRVQLNIHCDF